MHSPRLVLALLLAATLTGCTHWVRDDGVILQPVPEREKVEIHSGGMSVVAQGLRVDSQTVSYVKFFQDPACDSCRASIPRASIDSIRVSAISAPRTVVLVAGILIFLKVLSGIPDDSGAY